MPVPVSVSGWKSEAGGGVDVSASVMETAGPFAALAKRKAELEAAEAAGTSEVTVTADAAVVAKAAVATTDAPVATTAQPSEWGVCVNNLDWSYPGIDGSPIVGSEPLIPERHADHQTIAGDRHRVAEEVGSLVRGPSHPVAGRQCVVLS